MDLRPRKRVSCSEDDDVGRDRLSEMPDDIIVHILSFLPTFDAVRTVLLRRFGNLWTLVPTLKFEIYEFLNVVDPEFQRGNDDIGLFYIFVNNVLRLHKNLSIDKFHLSQFTSCYEESFHAACGTKMWLRFALDRQAKEINFYCDIDLRFPDVYPNFTSKFLVTLKLHGGYILPQHQINLGSLKKLSLLEVYICAEAFQQFLCGCPSLQELDIQNPYLMNKLSFNAPNIRKLSLTLDDLYCCENSMCLEFPNLKSLELDIEQRPLITDVSSVREVYIEGFLNDIRDDDDYTMLETFLRKFESAEVFRFSHKTSMQFLDAIHNLRLSQIKWKHVVLELAAFYEGNMNGIYELTRSLIHLEELIIYIKEVDVITYTSEDSSDEDTTAWVPVELSLPPCVMPKLKTVIFYGYMIPLNHHLQLVEFLLKNAGVLDKLIFAPYKYQCSVTAAEKRVFVKRVSTFRRSSPNATVVFA